MSSDPRDRDFVTQSFEHGAHHEFMKCEIVTRLRVWPTITAQGHMESEAKWKQVPVEEVGG
jgi:hypothetical protein